MTIKINKPWERDLRISPDSVEVNIFSFKTIFHFSEADVTSFDGLQSFCTNGYECA